VTLTAANGAGTSPPATLTITVAPAGVAPIITSPINALGTAGTAFVTYSIVATGLPTSFGATGLPAGLSLNSATGAINGTPTTAGVSVAALSATNGTGTGTAVLTITIAPAGAAPIIVGPTAAPGTVGAAFTYNIAASGTPTSYGATGLPAGLSVNSVTGAINGTPTTAGVSVVALGATNGVGTGTAVLTITIAAAGAVPIIVGPSTAPGTVGAAFTYNIAASGTPTGYAATGLPSGLTLNALTGAINGVPSASGVFVVAIAATNSAGTGTATLTITVAAAVGAPIIIGPTSAQGTTGTVFVTYPITATGTPTSYTATGLPPGLTLNPLTGAINGTPTGSGTFVVTITATNSSGTSTATLTITIAGPPYARIANFSARAISGPGSLSMIVGFVVSGNGKNLLIRGVGPGLAALGIVSPLNDPMLALYSGNSVIATNSNWQTTSGGQAQGPIITATDTQVGAFALQSANADTAVLVTVNQGPYTANVLSPNGSSGVALAEIYDADVTANPVARLVNVSARMNVTAGQGTLIAGLVIEGNIPQTLLVRGVGPALSAYGVSNVLSDPQIAVFSGGSSTQFAANSSWGVGNSTVAQLSAAAVQVGAFPLPTGSKDSALLLTLQPGAYTVQVSSVSGTTGTALVEIYDTQ